MFKNIYTKRPKDTPVTVYISSISLIIVSAVISLLLLVSPQRVKGDNLYGIDCGPNLVCTGVQTCQKTYRGVLPIQDPNPSSDDLDKYYSCLADPEDNPDCEGQDVSDENSGYTNGTEIEVTYTCVDPPFIEAPNSIYKGPVNADGYNTSVPRLDDPGVPVNIINQGPLPVDIFNPLPLPTNIVSPNPLPVVVVDDLALYQQKELIDAPLREQQKAQTLGTATDNLRYEIINNELIVRNYYDLKKLAFDTATTNPQTGVLSKDSVDTYSNYNSIKLDEILSNLTDSYEQQKNLQLLPEPDYNDTCEGKVEEATTLECIIKGAEFANNPNTIAQLILPAAINTKLEEAYSALQQEANNGDGFIGKTENNDTNPLTKRIATPSTNIKDLTEELLSATIDQTVNADQCFAAGPENILKILTSHIEDGLFGNITPTETEETSENEEQENTNEDLFIAIQDELLKTVSESFTCQMSNTLSGLFNDWLNV